MTERMIVNRVRKLKELEIQQKAGDYTVRFTVVTTNRFDGKTFGKEHSKLYNQYLKSVESRRFSIA